MAHHLVRLLQLELFNPEGAFLVFNIETSCKGDFMEATNLVWGRALLVCGGQGDCLAGHWELNHLATRTTRALVVSPAGVLTILFSTLKASSGKPTIPRNPFLISSPFTLESQLEILKSPCH